MEERRLLAAVALSLLVITAYGYLFPPAPRRVPPRSGPSVSAPPASESPAEPPAVRAAASVPPAAPLTRPVIGDDRERRVEVVGKDVTIAFTSKGARLLSWRLAGYKDSRGRPEEMVLTVPGESRALDLETGDRALDARLLEALFRPSTSAPVSDVSEVTVAVPEGGETTVRFQYADGDLEAEKTFVFQGRGYLAAVGATIRQGGRDVPRKIVWGPALGNPTPQEKEVQGYQAPQAVVLADGALERVPPGKLAAPRSIPAALWVGVESHYFAALLVPPGGRGAVELRAVPLRVPDEAKPESAPVAVVDLGVSTEPALLYVGPKDHHEMSRLGHRLAEVVPVGEWIGPIVVPLMALLRWVHSHVGNYGWSIVVLTVLINLAMAPFRHYSIANGLKMAKLSPEMKVIQDRYRKVPLMDPKRQDMQQEIGELYAKHGMSMGTQMMVGCLPILLTMPFLIAFYRVLQVSIELRGAPFLWIGDLSQKDPLFITPILMGLSMFVMQRMTPTTIDPAQQRVMMIMPIMLMGMFLWAPGGLNLYWLASNLCSILQQTVTLRILRSRDAVPARERKKK